MKQPEEGHLEERRSNKEHLEERQSKKKKFGGEVI